MNTEQTASTPPVSQCQGCADAIRQRVAAIAVALRMGRRG